MLIVRSLFWIVCVSLLLAGGNGLPAFYGDRPGSDYVNEASPAYRSAERVVASVSQLDGWCLSHEKVCDVSSTAGHLALRLVDGAARWTISQLAATTQRIAADENSEKAARSGETAGVSLLDGITDLLYDENEELDDIG